MVSLSFLMNDNYSFTLQIKDFTPMKSVWNVVFGCSRCSKYTHSLYYEAQLPPIIARSQIVTAINFISWYMEEIIERRLRKE